MGDLAQVMQEYGSSEGCGCGGGGGGTNVLGKQKSQLRQIQFSQTWISFAFFIHDAPSELLFNNSRVLLHSLVG